MDDKQPGPATVAAYIAGYPADIQGILQTIRQTIVAVAPQAQETIKYQIPTYTLHGNLISFAAYKKHIGLYPAPAAADLADALAPYRTEKSTLRFPLDQPIPYDLIREVVKARVEEVTARAAAKGKKG